MSNPSALERLELNYERRGSGQPLVLLHGVGHHWQAWDPVLDTLAEHHDVIAVDFPGFGRSPAIPPGTPFALDLLIDVMRGFFDRLGLDRPHVAGNSMGGFVSLVLAQRGLARSVTAVSPACFWTPAERAYAVAVLRTFRLTAKRMTPSLVERLAHTKYGRTIATGMVYGKPALRDPDVVISEVAALRAAAAFEPTIAASRGLVFTGDIPDVPVTIAWGTHDRILPRRQGLRAARIIPGARLVQLPGCGHVPMSDDPVLVAKVILDGAGRQ